MFQPIFDALFLLGYAGIFTAVIPYIVGASDDYGVFIPGAMGLGVSSVVWVVLNWVGLSDTDGLLWTIAMVAMPIGGVLLSRVYGKARVAGKLGFVDTMRGGSAADDSVVLFA